MVPQLQLEATSRFFCLVSEMKVPKDYRFLIEFNTKLYFDVTCDQTVETEVGKSRQRCE